MQYIVKRRAVIVEFDNEAPSVTGLSPAGGSVRTIRPIWGQVEFPVHGDAGDGTWLLRGPRVREDGSESAVRCEVVLTMIDKMHEWLIDVTMAVVR